MTSPAESPTSQQAAGKSPYRVRPMRPEEAERVAAYHQEGIPTGVLAELGTKVLTKLYRTLAASEDDFVFVAVDEGDQVIGFVSGVTDVGRMYKRVLRRHLVAFALVGLKHVFNRRMLRRIWESLRYPLKVKESFPAAELLSIVVDAKARGSSVATNLLTALLAEFRARRVDKIKVMVRADFERANAYYQKHGFEPAGQVTSHGYPSNIYVIETAQP